MAGMERTKIQAARSEALSWDARGEKSACKWNTTLPMEIQLSRPRMPSKTILSVAKGIFIWHHTGPSLPDLLQVM
jgi:hypothetical protein